METKEYKVDKTDWPRGEWDTEPDRVQWQEGDFACLMIRNTLGNWCGYVGVPPGHPFHGKQYDDVDVRVHCGLTYSDECKGHVCHTPEPGQPDNVWWFGFDFAHLYDYVPGMHGNEIVKIFRSGGLSHPVDPGERGERYYNVQLVKKEVSNLAKQLKEARA